MNRFILLLLIFSTLAGCDGNKKATGRIPVARAGEKVLYFDEIPHQMTDGLTGTDSVTMIRNYINQWAKKELMFQIAEKNISGEVMRSIEKQLDENRFNLIVYEYQQQMMLQKMDTIIADRDLEDYYTRNEKSFILTSNIVKALFIKLPVETPEISRFRTLIRSNRPKDMQELESLCYQFAEKYDDFDEHWVSLDRLALELNKGISDQENFLKWNNYYESSDSTSVYLLGISDYRLRGTVAPFEFVKDDIKRIIWNDRRIGFLRDLENGIYNDALKENGIKIY